MSHQHLPLTRVAALLAAALLVSCASLTNSGDSDRFLYLDTADTLQIRFHYSADPRLTMSAPSIADETEELRFRDYYQTMTAVLAEIGLPMEYRILRQNEEPEQGHPLLDLTALRWQETSLGEIEAVLQARLISYGEQNTLGVFSSEDYPPPTTSVELRDQVYRNTMRESLTKMLSELLTHFEIPDDQMPSQDLPYPGLFTSFLLRVGEARPEADLAHLAT